MPGKLIAAGIGLTMTVTLVSSGRLDAPAGSGPAPTVVPAALSTCGFGPDDGSAGATVQPASATPITAKATAAAETPPDFEQSVSPSATREQTVSFGGARVAMPPGSLADPVTIGVSDLTAGELPKVDSDMTNVTGETRAGFQFTPHPFEFNSDVELTIPYDPKLLPSGLTGGDIYTYFYDDVSLCWKPLERKSVDETNHTVTSLTNHFTDFINTTVTAPEHPENVSFNPNEIKGIQSADPGAKVNLIAPPEGNSTGDNRLSYPIEVPPGRAGLAPRPAITYNSAASDGWLGVGWDLRTPAITVDHRWGVPRFDAVKETETYQLNGEQLTPVANRGAPVSRTPEKVFHTRIEGGFARIVRHGDDPKSYTWEVVDKTGTHYFYGAVRGADGPAADATLATDSGAVDLWALAEVRDAHDNLMRYHYKLQADPGVDGGTPGRDLYVTRITYTGTGTGTGSGGTEGRYSVNFTRDRDLGEPPRADKIIDARGRFKRVTADLLRRIDVKLDDDLIRGYELTYTTGAFHKTLLASITQLDDHGAPFNKHEFGYYDDIRDKDGNYQAFKPAAWTSPGDDLSSDALNLTDKNAGKASALNAGSSTTVGGHLYIGVAPVTSGGSKSQSIGLAAGGSHTSAESVLALADVDGDNLPDKVFRAGGDGPVRYHKNLSGPHGEPRFAADSQPLNLPGLSDESSTSQTLGIEGYGGGVAAQLDYVNSFTSTGRYFSDVNGDGITDLVNRSSVLFGRVGENGVPVYGISSDTPVPVTPGHLDADGLFGDFAKDRARLNDSLPLLDTVRRWVAPYDGKVRIQGPVKLAAVTAADRATAKTADGVRVAIQHEGTELWSDTIGPRDDAPHAPAGVDSVDVHRGDRLYFRVQSVDDGSLDQVSWDPKIDYLGVPNAIDVNGLSAYGFQASADFTLGGRAAEVKAPLTGTLHLSGDLRKAKATTDDVTVVITRDGTEVFRQRLGAAAAGPAGPDGPGGTVPIDLDVPVHKGDKLKWRLAIDSPIDLGALSWKPRAFYTAADGVDHVNDDKGNPLIEVFPPYEVDMYPVDGLTAPQSPFPAAPADGDVTVSPVLSFDFGDKDPKPSGEVVFTVKRRGELVAKSTFTIKDGVVSNPGPVVVKESPPQVSPGEEIPPDELFFDFSTRDPKLRQFLTGQGVVTQVEGGDPRNAPSAFHNATTEDAFPQPYRGWGAIGYNGNGDLAAKPIEQGNLVIDDSFDDQIPDDVDPQAQKDDFGQNPTTAPPKAVPFRASPNDDRWDAGDQSFVTRDGASSSRLGGGSIGLPKPSDLDGGQAVPRLSRSQQLSLTGSAGGVATAGGSRSTGESSGQVDYLDMNGDGFPDVVGAGHIQYTDPTGGLGDTHGSLPDNEDAVRTSKNEAGNASAGAAARTKATADGDAAPSGSASANRAEAGNDMPPLGIGGSLGGSTSSAQYDLLDVNGDGLPDRVYDNGDVALNYGYGFGAKEHWRNPAHLGDGTGGNFGLNLGFNTDFYGFGGGVSYDEATTSSKATLADMNGDGLPDRVIAGNPIKVGINTGNGFEPPVEFRGSLPADDADASVVADQNATLGGGAYFTFSICYIFICVVVNPGASVSKGVSRSERMLRDINGDGFADQLASTRDDQLNVAANTTGRTNLLRAVDRPLGGRLDFDYSRDGNNYGQPQSKFVLSKVSVDDGQPGDGQDVRLTTYEYGGGVYDRLEREFDGYARVVERDRDPGAPNDAVFRDVTTDYRTDGHYTHGLPIRQVTTDKDDHKFDETEYTYTPRDIDHPDAAADPHSTTATIFPALTRTDQRFFEGQDDPGKTTFTTLDYDQFGNVTRSFEANDAGAGDDTDTRMRYSAEDAACRASNIVGAATAIDVTGGGALMRHRESTVDCANGNVTQVRARLANGDTAGTDLDYLGNGNLRSITNPPNKDGQRFKQDFGYDEVVGIYPESVTDSFGYHSSSTHDFKFGQTTSSTDINGQVSRTTFDSAGRPATVTGPYEAADNNVTIRFEYHPLADVPYAVTRHIDRQADNTVRPDTIDTITFTDGTDRVIQTKTDATVSTGPNTPPQDVMVVSGRAVLDFLGRVVKAYYPVTEPKGAGDTTFNPAFDTVSPTVSTYDVLDRVTKVVLPDKTETSATYGFGKDRAGDTRFETIATDANGRTKRTYQDVRRQTTALKEFNPAGHQDVIWTSYGYDALGQKTSIVDDHNNTTTMAYDDLGRRTSVTSPDSGRTDAAYDLAGNLTKEITAKLAAQNKAIEYDYDFNRLKAIRYPTFTGNNVTYTYGGPGAPNNAANRITAVVDGAGSVTRQYGPLGELTKESRTVATQGGHTSTFTTQYQYDTWNRMLKLTYPDGEVLSYRYNSGGMVDSARGVKNGTTYQYLSRLDYDKFGQRVRLDTGNGTHTTYTYDSENQRLANIKANIAQGYVFQNLNYSYDNVGNVTAITNDTVAPPGPEVGTQVGGPSSETFGYDDLYRLTHAEGSYQPRTPQTDKYRLDLSYDSISDITNKTQAHQLVSNGNTITDGKLSYNSDYAYGNAQQPHAATTIGIQTFAYDANGNQISRDQQPQPRRQLIWDEKNRLACDHENVQSQTLPQSPDSCDNAGGAPSVRFFYDDQGRRIIKDGAQFHIYPNQNYSTRGNQAFKHIYIGNTKLLTKTVDDHKVEDRQFYSHDDQLGSTGFVTDASGGLAEHLQYIPGGETWVDEHPSQPVPQQYTGKEFDPETNLYYYGARYYDPRTQAWQSPDPALPDSADDSTSLSAYLYVDANPLIHTDPDGRQPAPLNTEQAYQETLHEMGKASVELMAGGKFSTDGSGRERFDPPSNGVGGVAGGVVSALTFRQIPVDPEATGLSEAGAEIGAFATSCFLPNDAAARLVTGKTVTGKEASRFWAAVEVLAWFAPEIIERIPGPKPVKPPAILAYDLGGGPQNARNTAAFVKGHNGAAPPGYKGGKVFANDGRAGSAGLPKQSINGTDLTYREYDINPHAGPGTRGDERIVVGDQDGRVYYTNDHYQSFTRIE